MLTLQAQLVYYKNAKDGMKLIEIIKQIKRYKKHNIIIEVCVEETKDYNIHI